MAFWGVHVKSGNAYIHTSRNSSGRLHISQATLGLEKKTDQSSVQCKIGDSRPVLLCTLIPGKTESLQLDLEFDEVEDVTFSVIGPRSVYLTGYYVSNSRQTNLLEESEPEGEDIGNSDTYELNREDEDDHYDCEDSFINDDYESPKKKQVSNGGLKKLKKKNESTESNDVEIVADSEEEEEEEKVATATSKSKKRRRWHSFKTKDDETSSA